MGSIGRVIGTAAAVSNCQIVVHTWKRVEPQTLSPPHVITVIIKH